MAVFLDDLGEIRNVHNPLRSDVTELIEVAPQSVDRFGPLFDELLSDAKRYCLSLLLCRLGFNKPHGWAQGCLDNRLSVSSVVFLTL